MKKSFTQFLAETHYGSLVDEEKYNDLDKADKKLYKYTADGMTDLGGVIKDLQKRYPFDGGVLYRGLHFDEQDAHDEFLAKAHEGKLTIHTTSSWTPSKSTGLEFATSKKSYFPTFSLMMSSKDMTSRGDHMTGHGGIVIKTKVPKGVGCDVNKSEFAKEKEVILPAGEYEIEIEQITIPYKRQYDAVEKLEPVFKEMKKAKERSPELDKKYEFITKTYKDKLSDKQTDILVSYWNSKLFSMTPEQIKDKCVSLEFTETFDTHFNKNLKDHEKEFRLRLGALAPFSPDDIKNASPAMQAKMNKIIKIVFKSLGDVVQKLLKEPKLEQCVEFDIFGVNHLRSYDEAALDKITRPLKQAFGKRYHALNDREYLKKIDVNSRDALRKHGETVAKVLTAITQL